MAVEPGQAVIAIVAGQPVLAAGAGDQVVAIAADGDDAVGDAGDGDIDRRGAAEPAAVGDGVGEAVDRGRARRQRVEAVVVGDVAQRLRRGVEDQAAERARPVDRADRQRVAGVDVDVVAEQLRPQIGARRILVDRDRVGDGDRRFVDVADRDRQRLLAREADRCRSPGRR